MSLKILDSLENLGSHLDQTNQEWLDSVQWTQLLYFLWCPLSSNDKQATSYSLNNLDQHCLVAKIITLARTKLLQYDCSNWVQDQQCEQTKLRAINCQHFLGIHMEAKSVMENWGHLLYLYLIGSLWIDSNHNMVMDVNNFGPFWKSCRIKGCLLRPVFLRHG